MKRETIAPRAGALDLVKKLGLIYAGTDGNPYWDETACYHFSEEQILEVERATAELNVMCLQAVQHVIDRDLFHRLKIPEKAAPCITRSWEAGEPYLMGRFDLAYDGKSPPKMLEFNADTPVTLVEASLLQYHWMMAQKELCKIPADADQFNFVHESLERAWRKVGDELVARHPGMEKRVHLACYTEHDEDLQNTQYQADMAECGGWKAQVLDIEAIQSDGLRFYDEHGDRIHMLHKLYPWEWMVEDRFGDVALNGRTHFLEPAWKMILSSKGVMAILWEMFPGHPNLLPTFDAPGKIKGSYVEKPFFSREGLNVEIHDTRDAETSGGLYGREGTIYQAYAPLPDFGGNYPIIGSWVTSSYPVYATLPTHALGGEACGMGIREDRSRITKEFSRFVPHYFTPTL